MGLLDLGMDDEAERERERLERERLERRARIEAEARALRESAGAGDAEIDATAAALRGMQQEEPPQRTATIHADPQPNPERGPNGEVTWSGTRTAITGPADPRVEAIDRELREPGGRGRVETRVIEESAGRPQASDLRQMPQETRSAPRGPRVSGTIDLDRRPVVRNPDGSISTVRSASFGADDGEWLVPTVSDDGRIMDDREAFDTARRTGRHLGIFDTPEDATRYAEKLHQTQERQYAGREPSPASRGDRASSLASPVDAAMRAKPRELPRPTGDDALDRGLPRDSDISDARTRDAIRSPFRALGRALQVAAGRDPGARAPSEADSLQARRDAGMRERLSAKQQVRGEERAEGRERTRAASAASAAASQSDIARQRLAQQGRQADAQTRLAEARTRREEESGVLSAAMRDPESDVSRRARERYVLEAMDRERVRAGGSRTALEIAQEVRGLSAADIEAMEGELPGVTMGTRGRGAGTGGAAYGANLEALRQEAIAHGVPEATARTMSARQLQGEIAQRTRRTSGAQEGDEILPGVQAGIHLERGEARAIRQGFAQARSQMAALGEIERIAGRYGPSAAISREAAGELAAPIASMRAMVANLQHTGVINPSEAPAIEAMLPNPQSLSQMTFGDLQSRLRSFRGALERAVDSELETRGVAPEGRRTALGLLRGRGGPAQPSAGPTFTVTAPDGRTRTGPLSDEDRRRLESAGYTVEPADGP